MGNCDTVDTYYNTKGSCDWDPITRNVPPGGQQTPNSVSSEQASDLWLTRSTTSATKVKRLPMLPRK